MTSFIVTEGTPTAWGGRTVKLTPVEHPQRAERKEWNAIDDDFLLRGRRGGLSFKEIARSLKRTPAGVTARFVFLKREKMA